MNAKKRPSRDGEGRRPGFGVMLAWMLAIDLAVVAVVRLVWF